jgi:3D (Asp-Asp-Asp) domain-containing protein
MGFKTLVTQVRAARQGIDEQSDALDALRTKNDLALRRAEQDAARSRDQEAAQRGLTRARRDAARAEAELASKVSTQAKAFAELGISQRNLAEHGDDLEWVLTRVADGLDAMPNGTEKAALTARLFGRAWTSVAPLLRSGSDEMRRQLDLADTYGATFGDKTVGDIQRLLQAQREQRLAWLGIDVALGQALIPTLTKGSRIFADFVAGMREGRGAGGEVAHAFAEVTEEARDAARWVGHAAEDVGHFAEEHPAVMKVAGALLTAGLALKAISFAGQITGISKLISLGVRLASVYRGTAVAAETAATAETAASTASGVGGVSAARGRLAGRAGLGLGIGIGGSLLGSQIGGRAGSAVSAAATGAGIGMIAGPWGAAAGAGIGALTSFANHGESLAQKINRVTKSFDARAVKHFAGEAERLRMQGDAPGLDRLRDRLSHLRTYTRDGADALDELRSRIRATSRDLTDQSWDLASPLVRGFARAKGVNRQNLAELVNQFAVLTPAMRQETATALLAQVRILESRGKLVKGSTRALVATINAEWRTIDTEASKAVADVTTSLATGLARAIPIVKPAAQTLAREMRLAMHGEFAQIRLDFLHAVANAATPQGARSVGLGAGTLAGFIGNLLQSKRTGGVIRRYREGGLVPAFVSPGEEIESGGRSWVVPGARVAADSVFAWLPDGARVWTGHGQRLRAAGVPDDIALATQAPHFASGGVVQRYRAGTSFVATAYGPPWGGMQGTGRTATGVDLRDGRAAYIVAVDPSVVPLHSRLKAWPNPFGYRGEFSAEDTGGAIKGARLDFYDWKGRGHQNAWGRRTVTVSNVHRAARGYTRPEIVLHPRSGDLLQPYGTLDAFDQGFQTALEQRRSIWRTGTGMDSDLFRSAISGVRPNARDLPHRLHLKTTSAGAGGLGMWRPGMNTLTWGRAFGSKFGLRMTSTWRSPSHNAAVGGVPNSKHTHGSMSNPGAIDWLPPSQAAAAYARNHGVPEVLIHNAGSGVHLHTGFFRRGGIASFRAGGTSRRATGSLLSNVAGAGTRGSAPAVVGLMRQFADRIDDVDRVAYRRLERLDQGVRDEIRQLALGGLTGRERVQVRRLRGTLTLLEGEMGRRVGLVASGAQRALDAVGRHQAATSRRLAIAGVDAGSAQGLATLLELDTGGLSLLRRSLAQTRSAIRRARRAHDPEAVRALRDQADTIGEQIDDTRVSLAQRRRDLEHARRYDPLDAQLALDQLSGDQGAQLNDLKALRALLTGDLEDAKRRHDFQAIQDLAGQLQSVDGSIRDLTEAQNEANRIAQDRMELDRQLAENQRRMLAVAQSQPNVLLGAIVAALNGQIGGRLGLGFQTPGTAGKPGMY